MEFNKTNIIIIPKQPNKLSKQQHKKLEALKKNYERMQDRSTRFNDDQQHH
jgi:hypothetical protein